MSRVQFPDGVIRIVHWHNPSGRAMALGLTQPLTEMSTRNISWGLKAAGARADNLTTFMWRLSWNLEASTSWNTQGLSRLVMGLFRRCISIFLGKELKIPSVFTGTTTLYRRATRSPSRGTPTVHFLNTVRYRGWHVNTIPVTPITRVRSSLCRFPRNWQLLGRSIKPNFDPKRFFEIKPFQCFMSLHSSHRD